MPSPPPTQNKNRAQLLFWRNSGASQGDHYLNWGALQLQPPSKKKSWILFCEAALLEIILLKNEKIPTRSFFKFVPSLFSLLGLLWHNPTDWVTKTPEICFLIVLEAGIPRSRRQRVWFLPRPLSLACRWLPFPSVLTWSFLCASVP